MEQSPGRVVVIEVNGKEIECVTIGSLAAAVGRKPRTIRHWEAIGLIPPPPFMLPGEYNTKRRLYPITLVDVIKRVAEQEGFGRRRPSGLFWRQQQEIYTAWNLALEPIRDKAGCYRLPSR